MIVSRKFIEKPIFNWICNFCGEKAIHKVDFHTSKNDLTSVRYCEKHYTELKKGFIDQLLIEKEEEVI
jgi:hypothetical protein